MAGLPNTENNFESEWSECYRRWKTRRADDFAKSTKALQQKWESVDSDIVKRFITFQGASTFMSYLWPSIKDHGNLPRNTIMGSYISDFIEVVDTRVFSSTNPFSGKVMAVMVAVSLKQGGKMNPEIVAELKSSFQRFLDSWMNGERCHAILFTMPQIIQFKYGGLHSAEEIAVNFGAEISVHATETLGDKKEVRTFRPYRPFRR